MGPWTRRVEDGGFDVLAVTGHSFLHGRGIDRIEVRARGPGRVGKFGGVVADAVAWVSGVRLWGELGAGGAGGWRGGRWCGGYPGEGFEEGAAVHLSSFGMMSKQKSVSLTTGKVSAM